MLTWATFRSCSNGSAAEAAAAHPHQATRARRDRNDASLGNWIPVLNALAAVATGGKLVDLALRQLEKAISDNPSYESGLYVQGGVG